MNKLIGTRLITASLSCLMIVLFFFFGSLQADGTLHAPGNLQTSDYPSWEWDDSDEIEQESQLAHHQYKPVVEKWELMKDQYGVQLYLGNIAGTDVKAFKGVVRINSSINSLLAVLIDTKACPQWVHDCESAILVSGNGIKNRYVFQTYDLMFPAGKRDYLFYASVHQDPISHTVTIEMEATPDYCKNNPTPECLTINQSNNIMIQKSRGAYRLEPMPDGSTLVTWEQFTDPAGALPILIVNQLVLNVPFMTLKGLQEVVQEERYQLADNILEKDFMLTGNIDE